MICKFVNDFNIQIMDFACREAACGHVWSAKKLSPLCCVCERERKGERMGELERGREREREIKRGERGREGEKEGERRREKESESEREKKGAKESE